MFSWTGMTYGCWMKIHCWVSSYTTHKRSKINNFIFVSYWMKLTFLFVNTKKHHSHLKLKHLIVSIKYYFTHFCIFYNDIILSIQRAEFIWLNEWFFRRRIFYLCANFIILERFKFNFSFEEYLIQICFHKFVIVLCHVDE